MLWITPSTYGLKECVTVPDWGSLKPWWVRWCPPLLSRLALSWLLAEVSLEEVMATTFFLSVALEKKICKLTNYKTKPCTLRHKTTKHNPFGLHTTVQHEYFFLLFGQWVIRFISTTLSSQLLASVIKPLFVMWPYKLVEACDTLAALELRTTSKKCTGQCQRTVIWRLIDVGWWKMTNI